MQEWREENPVDSLDTGGGRGLKVALVVVVPKAASRVARGWP